MGKAKEIFTNWRVLLLLACIVLSLVVISPHPDAKGVAIRSVKTNTTASLAGMTNPKADSMPMARERILSINNLPADNVAAYYNVVENLPIGANVVIKTNKRVYTHEFTEAGMGLSVYEAPKSNIMQGLDLIGGTRVILKPAEGQEYTKDQLVLVVNNIKERLNVYGLKDITVKTTTSLTDTDFIIVEMAGVTKEEIEGLLEQQGKFEAKIGDNVVFEGGKKDIVYVCDSPQCSGVSMRSPCQEISEQLWSCSYEFQITISEDAADKFFAATSQLQDIGGHLSKNITFMVDDEKVSSLQIDSAFGAARKSTATITGYAQGNSHLDAFNNAVKEMNKMQSILVTGNLPIKLEREEFVFVSPVLGEKFLKNATLIGALSIFAVSLIIFLRYKKIKYSIPVTLTMISELIIILGLATLIRWNMDIPAIAGIIIAVGIGVDNLIVILDEQNIKDQETTNRKKRFKNAFFIIMGSYFTLGVTMLFLFFAGAGLLKGFALTTLVGATTGVFIARPAFATIIEILSKGDSSGDDE